MAASVRVEEPVFTSDKDIAAYANWLKEGAIKFNLIFQSFVENRYLHVG